MSKSGVVLPITIISQEDAIGKTVASVLHGYGQYIGLAFTDQTVVLWRLSVDYEDTVEVRAVAHIDDWGGTGIDVVRHKLVTQKQLDAAYRAHHRALEAEYQSKERAEYERLKAKYS